MDDDSHECNQSMRRSFTEEPNANSTMLNSKLCSQTDPCLRGSFTINHSVRMNTSRNVPTSFTPKNVPEQSECSSGDCSIHSIGHISHIPRAPPSPTTYTLPSFLDKSIGTVCGGIKDEDLFGMIKLKENDVCYTSGTIEWVGRKRSFPINSGFKLMNDQNCDKQMKKMRKLNTAFSCDIHKHMDCDCADVLPTVNAIVDHLNALHEAVDLVDLRLNTLEDVLSKKRGGK